MWTWPRQGIRRDRASRPEGVSLGQFQQDPGGGLGVDKSDAPPADAGPGHVVDQAVASPAAGVEGAVEVGNSIADVMDAGAAVLEKSGNRAVGVLGGEEFNLALAKLQGNDIRAVGDLGRMWRQAEHVTVKGKSRLDVRHGDPHVGNAGLG